MSSALSVDYVVTLVLAILLAVKYVLYDSDEDDATATVAMVTESTISAAANSPAVKSCFGDDISPIIDPKGLFMTLLVIHNVMHLHCIFIITVKLYICLYHMPFKKSF